MSWWTSDRQSYAVNYLVSRAGLSPMGAAGLVSRWANVEASSGPASINPYSGAFGIAQWLGSRLTPIRGNVSFDAQLAYAVRELLGTESRAGQVLRIAQTADQAAIGASMYERAEGYNSATGRDNFTSRTAAGIPAVLSASNAQLYPAPVPDTGDEDASVIGGYYDTGALLAGVQLPQAADDTVTAGIVLAGAGLLLYLIFS